LGYPFRGYERPSFYGVQPCFCQPPDKLNLRLNGYALLLILQAISRANLYDSDVVCQSSGGAREGAAGEVSEGIAAEAGGEERHDEWKFMRERIGPQLCSTYIDRL
jgi:hypothetical protein